MKKSTITLGLLIFLSILTGCNTTYKLEDDLQLTSPIKTAEPLVSVVEPSALSISEPQIGSIGIAPYIAASSPDACYNLDEPTLENMTSGESGIFTENPYTDYLAVTDEWRYPLYEIFRGAETVSFGDELHYRQDYYHIDTNDDEYWYSKEFTCEVTLPRAVHGEPWAEQINTYYLDIMSELRIEGDNLWREYTGNHPLVSYTNYYEGAYRLNNVITIMRSRYYNAGWRPSLNWTPFADLFSALDGKRLELDDLFAVTQDEYLPILYASLLNAENRFVQGHTPEYADWFKAYHREERITNFDRASVAITPAGLVFIYPTGSASDNATGVVFLDVPFSDLQGLLSPVLFPDYVATPEPLTIGRAAELFSLFLEDEIAIW
jgi:hypothetical protein